jgi:hypothetical protein
MQNPCLHRMPLLQLGPRFISPLLLRSEQLTVAGRRVRTLGKLSIYPIRILAGPWQRYLKFVWTTVTIASIEGLAVNLPGGKLFEAVEEAQTRKLTGLGTQPSGQRIGSSVADKSLQPLSGGYEGGSA